MSWLIPVGEILDRFMQWIATAVLACFDALFGAIGRVLLITPDVTSLPVVQALTGRATWIVDTVFVLAFVTAGILVMVAGGDEQSRYTVKDLAPRLVVGFISAHFSPLLCGMGTVQPVHLPSEGDLTESMRPPAPKKVSAWPDEVTTTTSFLDSVPASVAPQSEGDLSYQRIAEALRLCAGNQTRAAQMLGISRRTLVNRLNEYNLPRPRKRVS